MSEEDVPTAGSWCGILELEKGEENVHMGASWRGQSESEQDPRAFVQEREWQQPREIYYILIKCIIILRIKGARFLTVR